MFDKVRPKGKKQLVKAAQNLMNNSKPSKIATQLGSLLTQIDLQRAQFPHCINYIIKELVHDTKANKMFIQTDFNKDGSSYRSPYTNRYYPQRDEAYYPTPPLREIEEKGNILFDEYTRLYYGKQALGNFYAMQKQQLLSFAYVCYNKFDENGKKGCWNSTNIIQVAGDPSKSFNYKIQTIVLYEFQSQDGMSYSGSLKKSKVQSKKLTPQYEIEEFHLIAIGKMVQDMQTYMTQQIEGIYLAKTKDIVFKTRVKQNKEYQERKKKLAKELMELRPRDFVLQ